LLSTAGTPDSRRFSACQTASPPSYPLCSIIFRPGTIRARHVRAMLLTGQEICFEGGGQFTQMHVESGSAKAEARRYPLRDHDGSAENAKSTR